MKTVFLASLLAMLAACSAKREAAPGRLAILRFENLTGNPALDWMGLGAARQIAAQVEGAISADSFQIDGHAGTAAA